MIKLINTVPTHNVKRLADGKLFKVRCCKIKNGIEGDFDIIFQYYENGEWITNDDICSPKFTFHVPQKNIEQ